MKEKMNKLYQCISDSVKAEYTLENPVNLKDYSHLVTRKTVEIKTPRGATTKEIGIWSDAIDAAFADSACLEIPNISEDIFIDRTIVMKSGYKLRVDKNQRICLAPNTDLAFVRNLSILSGKEQEVHLDNPDTDIAIEGGIWDALYYSSEINNGNVRLLFDKENDIKGSFAIMLFSNVKDLIIKNAVFTNSCSYAVQISNCDGFCVSDSIFENYHKDGIHVNGNFKNGIIRNLSGKNMGDDMVAMNAWDWHSSAITYGYIENLIVENIKSEHNEFRLLPGRKTYSDGSSNECPIRNCILKNIEGVYTYKLYGQPYWLRPWDDNSEILGLIENVYFEDITFPEITPSGFGGLPVAGLFEICAETRNLYFDNIKVNNTADETREMGIPVIKVGPLSATHKKNEDDPDTWVELFYPDRDCLAKDTFVSNVTFGGKKAEAKDEDLIARAIEMKPNPDYPNSTPKGGTGKGYIENLIIS